MLIVGYSRAQAAPAGLAVAKLLAYSNQAETRPATLAIPAGVVAGSTLVAAVRFGKWTGTPPTVTPPPGWALVGADVSNTGLFVYRKTADGTESGTTPGWDLNTTYISAFAFAEVSGASGAVEVAFAPASLVPPAHAPLGGGAETVWIAVTTSRRNDNAVTAGPSGYGGFVQVESSTNNASNSGHVTLGAAHRKAAAASETPGAFTWSGSISGPQACTISVR